MDERGASTDFQQDRDYYMEWKGARQAAIMESGRQWGDEHGGPRMVGDSPVEHVRLQSIDRLLWPMLLTAALIGFVAGVYLGAQIPTVWP